MKIKKEHVFIGVLPFATGAAVWLVKLCHDKLMPRFGKKTDGADADASSQDIFAEEDLEQNFEEVPAADETAAGAAEAESFAEEEASAAEECAEEVPAEEEAPAGEECAEEAAL